MSFGGKCRGLPEYGWKPIGLNEQQPPYDVRRAGCRDLTV